MSKTPSGIPKDDETGPPFPETWHRFSGSEYPQTMFIFKDKKTSHVIIFKEFNNLQNLSQVFYGDYKGELQRTILQLSA